MDCFASLRSQPLALFAMTRMQQLVITHYPEFQQAVVPYQSASKFGFSSPPPAFSAFL